jgi:hypothetical protein
LGIHFFLECPKNTFRCPLYDIFSQINLLFFLPITDQQKIDRYGKNTLGSKLNALLVDAEPLKSVPDTCLAKTK